MKNLFAFLAVLSFAVPALAKDYTVTVSGQCVYEEGGRLLPVPGAYVEVRDNDWTPPSWDVVGPFIFGGDSDLCASGYTNASGQFYLTAVCGDPGEGFWGTPNFTKPDLYVRCAAMGPAGRVLGSSFPYSLYHAYTGARSDNASPLNVGQLRLPAGPSKVLISLRQAYDRVRSLTGAPLIPVWVMYPGGREAVIANTGEKYFASYAGAVFLSIAAGDEGGTVAHEYGHALQFESFLMDWSSINSVLNILRAGWEAIQHSTGAGHNFDTLSNPVMAFAEGWAEFHEWAVFGTGMPNCQKWTEIGKDESERVQVEGNVACRLQRLTQRWGYRDVWTAQTRSKAVRWEHFFNDYLKIHPDAGSVATPITLHTVAGLVVKRLTIATPQMMTVAAEPRRAPAAAAFARTMAVPRAVHPALIQRTLEQAEGPACDTVHESFARQVALLARACPGLTNPAQKQDCEGKLVKAQAQADGLGKFCPVIRPHYLRPAVIPAGMPHVVSPPALPPVARPPILAPVMNPPVLPRPLPLPNPR